MGGQDVTWEASLTDHAQMTLLPSCAMKRGKRQYGCCIFRIYDVFNFREITKRWRRTILCNKAWQVSPRAVTLCWLRDHLADYLIFTLEDIKSDCRVEFDTCTHIPSQEPCFCVHCCWDPVKLLPAKCG